MDKQEQIADDLLLYARQLGIDDAMDRLFWELLVAVLYRSMRLMLACSEALH